MEKFRELIRKHTPDILKTIFIHARIRCAYYFRYQKILAKNKELKNKYQGKRIFLIGSGSSLNQMDLTKLKNEYTFVFNFFYLHKDYKIIQPKFYSLMEPLESIPKGGFDIDKVFRKAGEAFKDLNVKMFFRIETEEYIKKNELFPGKDIYYLLPDRGILKTLIMNDDISKYYSFADASIYNAICISAYMGFTEIYLIGCDYDFLLHQGDLKHFYDNEIGEEINLFLTLRCARVGELADKIPYLKNANNLILAEDLVDYLKAMEKIKNHFKKYNVKIFNAGIGGLTDTFPRVDYDSLFQ